MNAYQVIFLGEGSVTEKACVISKLSLLILPIIKIQKKVCFLVDTDTEFGHVAEEAIQRAQKWASEGEVTIVYGKVCHPLGYDGGQVLLDPYLTHLDEKVPEEMRDLIEEVRLRNRDTLCMAQTLIVYSERPDGAVAFAKRYVNGMRVQVYDVTDIFKQASASADFSENPSTNPNQY